MKPNWFVALPVSWNGVSRVLSTLPPECRGFHPDDLHMTVAFLGAMPADRKEPVIEVMKGIQAGAMSVQLGPLLTLPSSSRVSALSFSVSAGREQVESLISQCRGPLLKAAGAKPDHRPPLAHLTIARPLRKARETGKRKAREWAGQVIPPENKLTLSRLALYTWADDRRTRQFQIVFETTLF